MSAATRANDRFTIPASASPYRKIGPFDAASVPPGLLREHRLKPDTWARLTVLAGQIEFAWDDVQDTGASVLLSAGDIIAVPPEVPHHLELRDNPVQFEIEFLSQQ